MLTNVTQSLLLNITRDPPFQTLNTARHWNTLQDFWAFFLQSPAAREHDVLLPAAEIFGAFLLKQLFYSDLLNMK